MLLELATARGGTAERMARIRQAAGAYASRCSHMEYAGACHVIRLSKKSRYERCVGCTRYR
jgi:hypothetical protein